MWGWMRQAGAWLGSIGGANRVDMDSTAEQWAGLSHKINEEKERVAESLVFALDAAQMGQWDFDLVNDTTHRSPAHDRIFGYSEPQPEWGWRAFLQHVVSEDREAVTEHFRNATQKGTELNTECRIIWADQSIHWISIRGRTYVNDQGVAVRTAGVVMDITQKKLVEAALRVSEARFRLVVEGIKDYAIFMLDPRGLVVTWNAGAERLKGYTADEIIGQHFSRFYPKEAAERRWPEHELEVAGKEGRFEDNGWRVRKDGSKFWANVIVTTLYNEAGDLVGFSKITRDITERKRAEDRFRLVVEAAPNAMVMVDRDRKITLVNSQTEHLFGYSREELIGERVEILVPERYRSDHPAYVSGFFREPQTRAMGAGRELFGRTKNGDEVPIEIGLNPITTIEGTFVLASIIDITERKQTQNVLLRSKAELEDRVRDRTAEMRRAKDAAEASERRVRLIVESAQDAFVSIDAEGRIIDWNPQAEATFGWSRQEALGRILSVTIIPERYQEAHTQGLRKFLTTGEGPVLNKRIELPAMHRDGHEFPVELTIFPVQLDETFVFCGFLHDITERQRTALDLQQARETAEQANRSKSEFLANMSHEIRTPMNGIIGMTELALDTDLTAAQHEYLSTVKSSAEALLTVINDILDFSKIEAGKLELDPVPFSLRNAISEMLKPLAVRADVKGLELANNIHQSVPDNLNGDLGRLRQIIINLVGNAIKFTSRGEVVLECGLWEGNESTKRRHRPRIPNRGCCIFRSGTPGLASPRTSSNQSSRRSFKPMAQWLASTAALVWVWQSPRDWLN